MNTPALKVQPDHWVVIHYSLYEENGDLIESSLEDEPLRFLQGHNQIIVGLENALLNRSVGDEFSVLVPAELAYGEYQNDLLQSVPLDAFEDGENLKEGMQFQAQDELGPVLVTVKAIEDGQVTLDTNHPFAGKNLKFDIEVVSVTSATEEELKDGQQ